MNNVLLGAVPVIEAQADYTGGGIVSSPIDMITLPIDTQTGGGFNYLPGGPAGGGGDISMERLDIPAEIPAEVPAETKTDSAAGMSKKNMLLIGIGALVLGYLVLRKK